MIKDMRIITLNLNGIRSAARAGFFKWVKTQGADIICLQETKAQQSQLSEEITQLENYFSYFADAEKKGYSGVALYSKKKPERIITQLGFPVADKEGRYLQADFGNLSVISMYLPSGTSGEFRQSLKYEFMEFFIEHLRKLRQEGRHYILCGDWNIAHKNIDLKNWRPNQKNTGFLPEERAWLTQVFDHEGFIDAFRLINQEADQYTWWSNRGQAYAKNVGWRIDYQIITSDLQEKVKTVAIYKEQRFSDHAPLIIDYDYEF